MRHIHHIFITAMLSSASLLSVYGQELPTDTLKEFVFTHTLNSQSVAYRNDSLSPAILKQSNTLVDALRQNYPVYIKDYGPGNIANLSLRGGTAQQVELYWNGMAINTPSLGLSDISLMPTSFICQAELSRGATSVVDGTGGASGALQLHSLDRTCEDELSIGYTVAPILGLSCTKAVISQTEKRLVWRTSLVRSSSDNRFDYVDDSGVEPIILQRENAQQESIGASQDFSWKMKGGYSGQVSFHYLNSQRQIASPIGIPNRKEEQDDEVFRTMASLSKISSRTSQEWAIGYINESQNYRSPLSDIDDLVGNQRIHARYSRNQQLSSRSFLKLRLDNDRSTLDLDLQERRTMNELGVFAGIEYQLNARTDLDIGLRQEWLDERINPMTASFAFSHRLPSVEGLNLIGSFSKTFRNPTLNDLYWPELGRTDLQAENGISLDILAEYAHGASRLALGCFFNDMTDMIIWMPADDGRFRPKNLSRSLGQGVEMTYQLRSEKIADIRIAYTYTSSRSLADDTDEWIQNIYQPLHQSSLQVNRSLKALELGYRFNYNSSVITDRSGSDRSQLPSIFLHDIILTWSPVDLKILEFGFEVKNLANRNYEFIKDRPIAGRYFTFTLMINLNEDS